MGEGLDRLVAQAGRYEAELTPLLSARVPSQLIQALAEGPLLFVLLWAVWAKPRKPGVVGATFLMGYGVQRVITEIWRLPDAQFAVGRPLGLSRGQWLSAAMVAGGVAMLVWALRRPSAKLGGWLRAERVEASVGAQRPGRRG